MESLSNLLTGTAHAQEAATPLTGGGGFASFIPLIAIFVIFYFLLIRPQQKKMKEHRAMLDAVRTGDKVITNGGIIGVVRGNNEALGALTLEIAKDTEIQVVRSMISDVLDSDKVKAAEKALAPTTKSAAKKTGTKKNNKATSKASGKKAAGK